MPRSDGAKERPRAGGRVPSLREVAREAGISVTTASRALDRERLHVVAGDTRRRVEAAAERLGYRPNPLARGLRALRMETIAVVVHDIADPYFAEIVRGVTDASRDRYLTMVCSSDRDPAIELRYVDLLIDHRVAALLFAGGGLEDRAYQRAMRLRVARIRAYGGAIVALGPRVERWPAEVTDNRGGARLATEHLIALGHRRIALVNGPPNVHTSAERAEGHLMAMGAAGLETVAAEEEAFRTPAGATAAARLLLRRVPFTGLFVASDTMAIGVVAELRRRGMRVPEDVSVVGFGDIPGWEFRHPPLTTVRSHLAAIGAAGVRRALAQLAGRGRSPRVHVHPVELVVRGSTAPAEAAVAP
ncbi:MAG: LacI family DNA-binding transcriptional regulator [Candidatus Dormibacteraceae bacterium]